MQLAPLAPLAPTTFRAAGPAATATSEPAPAVPRRWAKYGEEGLATFQYEGPAAGLVSSLAIPETKTDRNGNEAFTPRFAGKNWSDAAAAARLLARTVETTEYSNEDGDWYEIKTNPAVAMLWDAKTGFWITTMSGMIDDYEVPHAIDGASFSPDTITHANVVPRAEDVVAVFGRDRLIEFNDD